MKESSCFWLCMAVLKFTAPCATSTEPVATFSNPSPDRFDAFGSSVAVSDRYLVIGMDVHSTDATEPGGAVYVYDLASATRTTPLVTLTNPSPAIDVFGASVAISGTYVVVGAPFADMGAGRVYVYELASTTPTVPVAMLNNPTPEPPDRFGWSVAISGTRAVVSAPGDSTGAERAGSAYVYDMASATPTAPVATLNNPSPGVGDLFGRYVAVSGARVVVAAPGDDNTAVNDGTVYVYDLTSATPTAPTFTLTNPDPTTAEDGFGSSVAISGVRVVVGDTQNEGFGGTQPPVEAGSVYVYHLASATPTEPEITLDNPAAGLPFDNFGSAVGISRTRVVVGASYADVGTNNAGSAYVYDLASATPTVPVTTLHNPSPPANDHFGHSVALSGTRVLVGAPGDDTGATDTGSAYLYDLARTLYVSQTSPTPTAPYDAWETAAHTIQEAVDAAADGDTVLVAPDQYGLTNQVTIAKAIALRSTMGAGQTFLNSLTNIWCLWISNSLAVADGFTMQNTSSWHAGGGAYLVGGTVQNCNFANFTLSRLGASVVMAGGILSNSIVTYNRSPPGDNSSAVYCSGGGLITDCQILCNWGHYSGMGVYLVDSQLRNSIISGAGGGPFSNGVAVHALSSTIVGCTITRNRNAGSRGGGAYLDGCLMDRSIVAGNSCGDGGGRGSGGGIFAINSTIRDSLIVSNRISPNSAEPSFGGLGGGVYMQGGALVNCTVSANSVHSGIEAPGQGGGIYVENGLVRNSILYFNSASSNANWYNGGGSFDHSCTTPDPGGVGSISEEPQFIDRTNGNYRLAATSPCIAAGLNEPWMVGAQDLDGNPRIQNQTVDLGAWERPPMPIVTWITPTNGSSSPAGSDIRISVRTTDPDGSVSFVQFFANSTSLGQAVSTTDVYDFVWSNAPSGPFRLHAEGVDDAGERGVSDSVLIVVGATEPLAKLSRPGLAAGDNAGISVAISGTRAVVGAHLDDSGARDAGSAYVYDLASAMPTVPAVTLTNPNPVLDKSFGFSVAGSDARIVVGVPFEWRREGIAYVYDLDRAAPTEPVATLTNPTPEFDDEFGYSVAVAGTRVAVGAPYADQYLGNYWWLRDVGRAYVYDLISATPTEPVATLTNPSPATLGDAFGYSVAASGTRVVVGAPYEDAESAANAGSAYLYDLVSATPTLPVATLSSPSPATNAFFGCSIAMSGTRVAVGAYGARRVYVYDFASAIPSGPVAVLSNPSQQGSESDFFGSSVAISGTRVVVGAYHHEPDQTGVPGAGSIYVYDLASATPTAPVATLHNPSPAVDDRFGYSVAVSGAGVLVGAPGDDASAFDSGTAYVFGALPTLNIRPAESGFATVSWAPSASGFVLQYSDRLAPTNWVNASSGMENPATISMGNSTRFYRLFRP